MLKRGLSEEDHSVQALRLYRAHEVLRERIQIRRSRRQSNEAHALTDEDVTKLVCIIGQYGNDEPISGYFTSKARAAELLPLKLVVPP
jgi:hypothetical protein